MALNYGAWSQPSGYDTSTDLVDKFKTGFGFGSGIRNENDAKTSLGDYARSLYGAGPAAPPGTPPGAPVAPGTPTAPGGLPGAPVAPPGPDLMKYGLPDREELVRLLVNPETRPQGIALINDARAKYDDANDPMKQLQLQKERYSVAHMGDRAPVDPMSTPDGRAAIAAKYGLTGEALTAFTLTGKLPDGVGPPDPLSTPDGRFKLGGEYGLKGDALRDFTLTGKYSGTEPLAAPSGYEWVAGADGGKMLRAITGGPADKPPETPAAPSGYAWSADGKSLSPVPGGPADKEHMDRATPPAGYEWAEDGKSLRPIPGGPAGPTFDDVSGIRKEIQGLPSYKNFEQAQPIYKSMFETAGRNSKASDLNLVYGLGKIMDPTSVVREGEMVMVKNTASLPDWLVGSINALNGGAQLTPETRKAILTEAYGRMTGYKSALDKDVTAYRGIATRHGFNPDDILPPMGDFKEWTGASDPGIDALLDKYK